MLQEARMPKRERELEEGQEYCPICGRLNLPGASDTCGHHVALVWDAQITSEIDEMRALIDAWQELADIRYAFEEREHDFDVLVGPICEKLHISREAIDKFVETEKLNNGMEYGIQELFDFKHGESYSTGGMLGGFGYNIYLRKPKLRLKAVARDYRKVSADFRRRLQEFG
jgi:hypothetical protein